MAMSAEFEFEFVHKKNATFVLMHDIMFKSMPNSWPP